MDLNEKHTTFKKYNFALSHLLNIPSIFFYFLTKQSFSFLSEFLNPLNLFFDGFLIHDFLSVPILVHLDLIEANVQEDKKHEVSFEIQ